MQVTSLDHINITTSDMEGTVSFFIKVFGLELRDTPAHLSPEHIQWLYDKNGNSIIHVNSKEAQQLYDRPTPSGQVTGAIHHVAFSCTGHAAFAAHLKKLEIDFREKDTPSAQLRQIFVHEPNGVLIELNFVGQEEFA